MRARAASRAREADEERGPRQVPRIVLLFAGVAVGALAFGYVVTALAFGAARAPTDVALVPDVRDLTAAAAERELDDEGLLLEVGDSLPNATVPSGAILAQSPLPGQEVSPGTAVRVIVSSGQVQLRVPDVNAMPISLATRALQVTGFDVVVEESDVVGRPGRVIDMIPAAGTALPLPATVTLRVAARPPLLIVPPVIGMLEASARSLLEEAGLQVTEVRYEATPFGEPGGVVAQFPAPGVEVEAGAAIRLHVTEPAPPASEDRGVTRREDRGVTRQRVPSRRERVPG